MEDDGNSKSKVERTLQLFKTFVTDIVTSPINLLLLLVCLVLLYKIIRMRIKEEAPPQEHKRIPKLRKDMDVDELRQYDGKNEDGRILVAVNGKIFDVTHNGKTFYGPGGPYCVFAGRDASRALATFSLEVSALRDSYDDLSDLGTQQMEGLKEWELQFIEKYDFVGKLLKPGDNPSHYSDEEDMDDGIKQQSPPKQKSQ